MLKNKRGSITVFLCIVLPIIIILSLLLTDIYMLKAGRKIIENQVQLASSNVLAGYSTYLKDEYDLYAYCISDLQLKKNITNNIENNFKNLKLYNFKIKKISIEKKAPITDIDTISNQINTVMKDSIYKTLIKEVYDRIYTIQSIKDTIDVLNYKLKIDKVIKTINEKSKLLEDIISGRNKEVYINMLSDNLGLSDAINEFYNIYEQIKEINLKIKTLKQKKDESIYEVELLLQDKGYLKEKIVEVYEKSIALAVNSLLETNNKALQYIEDILLNTKQIYVLSNLLKNKIDDIDNCPMYIKEILKLALKKP